MSRQTITWCAFVHFAVSHSLCTKNISQNFCTIYRVRPRWHWNITHCAHRSEVFVHSSFAHDFLSVVVRTVTRLKAELIWWNIHNLAREKKGQHFHSKHFNSSAIINGSMQQIQSMFRSFNRIRRAQAKQMKTQAKKHWLKRRWLMGLVAIEK